MDRYEGQYVAIVGAAVAAHGRDANLVYEIAHKRHPNERILIAQVPVKEAMILWVVSVLSCLFPILKAEIRSVRNSIPAIARVTLRTLSGELFDITALVDSGADVSMFSPLPSPGEAPSSAS